MANKLCHITVLAYQYGDIPKGIQNGYDNDDLANAIEYCKELQSEGFREEPIDEFDLADFIRWAVAAMRNDS